MAEASKAALILRCSEVILKVGNVAKKYRGMDDNYCEGGQGPVQWTVSRKCLLSLRGHELKCLILGPSVISTTLSEPITK